MYNRRTLPILATLALALLCWPLSAKAVDQPGKAQEQMKEQGSFEQNSPKDRERKDCPGKTYPLKCVAGRTYTIDMRSDDFDAYLRLEDPGGKTVAEDDDGGNGLDSRIVFKAHETGTYTIAATAYNSEARGRYTLTVVNDGAGAGINNLLEVRAKLTTDDPKDKGREGGCYCKTYKLDLSAKTTYVIHMESRDFDTFLRLLDADGKEVGRDDDGAMDGLNSKLVYSCDKAGGYTIVATSFSSGEIGEFQLRAHVQK